MERTHAAPDADPPEVTPTPEEAGADWRVRGALSITEAGAVLDVSRTTAFELARQGVIPTIKLGGRRVVPTHALRKLLGETP